MRIRLLLLLALAAQSAAAGASAWSDYRYAPDAINEVDLASDADWTLAIDDGPKRPIKVTGGGWNSDQQEPLIPSAQVKDHVIYESKITIPTDSRGQAVKVLFGGCNYGAEVFLDEKKVCEHFAPMTPFVADLTGLARAGAIHRLRVKAYTRMHFGALPNVPVGFDFNQNIPGVFASNFLEGMSSERHPWRFNNDGNRRDGVDGWDSPMVQTVQRALHPFLVVDTGLLTMNPVIQEDSKSGTVRWPYRAPAYAPGNNIERALEVFRHTWAIPPTGVGGVDGPGVRPSAQQDVQVAVVIVIDPGHAPGVRDIRGNRTGDRRE